MFIGSVAFIFLIVCVIAYRLQKHDENNNSLQALYIPLVIMVILTLGDIYNIIAKVPLPLMNTERISSRFIIVPVMCKTLIISFWISMLTLLVAGTGILKNLFSNKAPTKNQIRL